MKKQKMTYINRTCELSIAENFRFRSDVPCDYDESTIQYAICRFFSQAYILQREWTYQSLQKRLESGKKARKELPFSYLFPASALELPGKWVQISGKINAVGVTVQFLKLS